MRRCCHRFRLVAAPLAASVGLAARPAHAIDAFEIQVYDGTANRTGAPGLELHVDHVLSGAKTAAPPELPSDHRTTFTLEPSYGLFDFWELGAYVQTALRSDGAFDYAGLKLRSKFVTPPGWHDPWRLGVNFEFSVLPRSYDRDRYGGELRPIAAWEDQHWLFAVNPIVDLSFEGEGWSRGPAFEPCVMAKRKLGPVAVGFEYYSGLGPIARPRAWSGQDEYVYETIDLISLPLVELNFGIGEGLSAASDGLVAKLNVGYVWESPAAASPSTLATSARRRWPGRASPRPPTQQATIDK